MSYRTDGRTKQQFKEDIKESHKLEAEIAIRLAIYFKNKNNKWPNIVPCGTDASGEFVDDKDVSNEPDFYIDPYYIEITRANPMCSRHFHQKVGKIKRCVGKKNYLMFVNGLKTDNPKFILLSPNEVDKFTKKSFSKYGETPCPTKDGFVNKKSYRYDIAWFDKLWRDLPKLNDASKKKYSYILDMVDGL